MPLPRLVTRLNLSNYSGNSDSSDAICIKKRYLPKEVVDKIVEWYEEFERARIKAYHYERFMQDYAMSLVKSSSRLRLYTRELKALGYKHRTFGEPPTFNRFVQDANRCKRNYASSYLDLKGIFF